MAFKLDFDKLTTSRTEEEREAQSLEFERVVKAKVAERTAKIDALQAVPELSEWERGFVRSMQTLATTYSMSGLFGGGLADLSDKQLTTLVGMYDKYVAGKVSRANESYGGKSC